MLIFVHSLSESRLELYIHPRCIFTFLSSQYNFFFRKRFSIGLLFIPFQLQQNVVFMDVLVFILHISHPPFSLRTKCARCDQGILSWYWMSLTGISRSRWFCIRSVNSIFHTCFSIRHVRTDRGTLYGVVDALVLVGLCCLPNRSNVYTHTQILNTSSVNEDGHIFLQIFLWQRNGLKSTPNRENNMAQFLIPLLSRRRRKKFNYAQINSIMHYCPLCGCLCHIKLTAIQCISFCLPKTEIIFGHKLYHKTSHGSKILDKSKVTLQVYGKWFCRILCVCCVIFSCLPNEVDFA